MKKLMLATSLAIMAVALSCADQGPAPSGPTTAAPAVTTQEVATPSSATIQFGRDDLGSPFPPPSGHDSSGHSRDSLFPQEVVIDKGGTVTFVMGASGVHEVAIYEPGTSPKDIDTSDLAMPAPGCPPVPTIDDSNHRITILSDQVCEGGSATPSYTFNTPGRYLVICTFLPHFNIGMYGWVTVRNR